jgi:DNA-binding NtrC family response regulator
MKKVTEKIENHKHKLIFIVEDNEMYSFMLDYLLSNEHSLRCLRFAKGEECIDSLHLNPDMIILDYVLPGISGLETFRKIKVEKPEVPVVILTGHYDVHAAQEFLKEGVCDYLLKEENAVNVVKKLMEDVLEKTDLIKEKLEEKKAAKRVLTTSLGVLCILAILAGAIWLISR